MKYVKRQKLNKKLRSTTATLNYIPRAITKDMTH